MTTGAEIVLEWFRVFSEQNGTPTPFEIRCQLELAIEHDKTELKKLRVADVSRCFGEDDLSNVYEDVDTNWQSFDDWFKLFSLFVGDKFIMLSVDLGTNQR